MIVYKSGIETCLTVLQGSDPSHRFGEQQGPQEHSGTKGMVEDFYVFSKSPMTSWNRHKGDQRPSLTCLLEKRFKNPGVHSELWVISALTKLRCPVSEDYTAGTQFCSMHCILFDCEIVRFNRNQTSFETILQLRLVDVESTLFCEVF